MGHRYSCVARDLREDRPLARQNQPSAPRAEGCSPNPYFYLFGGWVKIAMYYCMYYWIIAPLRGGIKDVPERLPAFALNVQALDGKDYELSLFCDHRNEPEFARCRIPSLGTEAIPDSILPLLQTIIEHLMSSLRLTYRMDLMLAQPSAVWSFFEESKPHEVSLSIQELGERTFDPQPVKNLFSASFNIRELVRLYLDGVDGGIPLQYRFLSLYKLIENRFRRRGYWENTSLDAFLQPYAAKFIDLGFKGAPASILHDLRDRCAHIKTGTKGVREVLGVTHLNHKEAVRVQHVLPLLRAICSVVINDRAKGAFALRTDVLQGPTL